MAPRTKASEPNAQPTISKFFSQAPKSKRNSTPIDLTLSDDEVDDRDASRPSKRPKLSNGLSSPENSNVSIQQFLTPKKNNKDKSSVFTPRPPDQSPVSKYTFSLHTPSRDASKDDGMSESAQAVSKVRRDAFRRKLDDRFERWEAKALQIAEGETQYDIDETGGQDGEEKDQDEEGESLGDDDEVQEIEESVTQKLKAFAAPTKSTAKISKSREKLTSEPKTKARGRTKKVEEVGPSGQNYTPLEKQILALKAEHEGCLLMFEVGYKMRFFGSDAQTASKELGIACFPDRNFLTAYIPTHRKNVHLKKLISLGYKVGIIGQTETAALKKVGDNKSGPFERKLTELYTAATFVDALDSADDGTDEARASPPSLACFVESPSSASNDQNVIIGMVAVVPSTGEVTYDEWEDSHMRTELETRITHIRPSELLIPDGKQLSKNTESVLQHFTGNKRFNAGQTVRVERFSEPMNSTDAFSLLSRFYHQRKGRSGDVIAVIVGLPKKVQVALAHAIQYLTTFGVSDAFSEATFFSTFSSRSHMLLNGTTLTNLEIFRNSTDFTEKGSLCWILDHTRTKFGSRMLKSWIGRPLTDKALLQERIDAVQEVIDDPPPAIEKFQTLLKGLPDLAKGLARISYGTCTPKELAGLLTAYQRISLAFDPSEPPPFMSPLWNDIVATLPKLRTPLLELTTIFNLTKARFDQPKADLWLDDERYPALDDCKYSIAAIEGELDEELKIIRKLLKRPSLNYTTVSGNEYLIEVRHTEAKKIPIEWMRVSSTKAVLRYHTPTVKKKLAEREQQRETLIQAAEAAWQNFLGECNRHYAVFRDATNKLAMAVAVQPGYTKPVISDDMDTLQVVEGRHPMVEAVRPDPFVPNTVMLGGNDTRVKIITGPNMNGKSTCCRMVALIAVMAQIGSYVPASSVTLSLHDCVLTRMGATDDLARGQSTFMVELQETSDIMRQATSRSLIILDELGRGTSTHDGQAIASAVLHHLLTAKKPKVLFITHYPLIAAEFAEEVFDDVANLHMSHATGTKRADGSSSINFLYRLSPGMASGSYGIECGRLAGLGRDVIAIAQSRSDKMRAIIEQSAGSRK
ncbi:Mismatch repair protein msh3 [Tulasnella sp. 331]|nr:Mismatch repair protein msh3 [Tulasnella sp. 331]